MQDICGQVVVITGASSGIGEAVARHLVSLGANVVLGARREDRLRALVQELGDQARWRKTDVAKREDLQALADCALEAFGSIDVLVNNAGIMPVSPLAMGNVDDWDRMIDVNLKGVLYGIHAVLDTMLKQGSGCIINMASVAAHHVGPGGAVYSGTKTAVRVISEGLRQEVSGVVRVCTVCPGLIESEIPNTITDAAIREQSAQLYTNAMPAQAIAEAVAYVVTQPPNVAVNELTVRPLAAQDF